MTHHYDIIVEKLLFTICTYVCNYLILYLCMCVSVLFNFISVFGVQPLAPVYVRANAIKAEFADIENLRSVLETKEEAVKEIKRLHKIKVLCCLTLFDERD